MTFNDNVVAAYGGVSLLRDALAQIALHAPTLLVEGTILLSVAVRLRREYERTRTTLDAVYAELDRLAKRQEEAATRSGEVT